MSTLICFALFVCGVLGASVERRQTDAQCDRACPSNIEPVCGSNGRTYSNTCFLEVAICREKVTAGRNMIMIHYGPCTGHENVHSNTRICDQICDEDIQYICGSDGNVYKNMCFFNVAQCKAANNGTKLFVVAFDDTCPKPRTPECAKYHIDTTDIAVESGTHIGNFRCPFTSIHVVCSSDGRTFTNECSMCHYLESHSDLQLQILHDGSCHLAGIIG